MFLTLFDSLWDRYEVFWMWNVGDVIRIGQYFRVNSIFNPYSNHTLTRTAFALRVLLTFMASFWSRFNDIFVYEEGYMCRISEYSLFHAVLSAYFTYTLTRTAFASTSF